MLGGGRNPAVLSRRLERMMKFKDVLLKAMAKKITWWAAS